jgi:hypothetical protein
MAPENALSAHHLAGRPRHWRLANDTAISIPEPEPMSAEAPAHHWRLANDTAISIPEPEPTSAKAPAHHWRLADNAAISAASNLAGARAARIAK